MTLKLRDAQGRFHNSGVYRSQEPKEVDWDNLSTEPVPHYQRVDPGRRFLASYDAGRFSLQLRSLRESLPVRRIPLRGISGEVMAMRWLASGRGLVFMTQSAGYIARFDPSAPPTTIRAKRVPLKMPAETTLQNVRILPGGPVFYAKGWGKDRPIGKVWYVPTRDARLRAPVAIAPKRGVPTGMTVRAGGQLVLVVSLYNSEGDIETKRVETYRISARGHARRVERIECESIEDCTPTNWTPGTRRLVWATEGQIVVSSRKPGDGHFHTFPADGLDVNTLWLDPAERRILVATDRSVTLYDLKGRRLWSFSDKDKDVHSAHFSEGGKAVVASIGKQVVRIVGGKARTLFATRTKPFKSDEDSETEMQNTVFIDDAIPLPGGGVAYVVVQTLIEEELLDMDEEEELEEDEGES